LNEQIAHHYGERNTFFFGNYTLVPIPAPLNSSELKSELRPKSLSKYRPELIEIRISTIRTEIMATDASQVSRGGLQTNPSPSLFVQKGYCINPQREFWGEDIIH